MFQLLFRYPAPVFTKGQFVLLGAWPHWLLPACVATFACALALLFYLRRNDAPSTMRGWRLWTLWGLQSLLVALLLTLLWRPAIRISELSSRQNIIAVVVDDSHSMAIADSDGRTREAAALAALQNGVLAGLNQRFQTQLYRLDSDVAKLDSLNNLKPSGSATHLSESLKQLSEQTSDLPVGAIVLLTDGGENSTGLGGSGIQADALEALRNRRIPVHTIGFGNEQSAHDIEIEDVSAPSSAVPHARLNTTVSFTQHGFAGQKTHLSVRADNTLLAARDVTLLPDGVLQTETFFFPTGDAGAHSIQFTIEPLAGEENTRNNTLERTLLVSDTKRRVLYIEGEPRWEYKFIRRAEDSDPSVEIVSMLRTSENKVYRQGIRDPSELAAGFPTNAEDLFRYSGIIIGSVDADYFTPMQQELLREFVDRRGGGVLFLGGRSALSDGGWSASGVNAVLPVFLPSGRSSFHRNSATVELTSAGMESPITRLLEDPARNADRWRKLTYLADYEDPGTPKPGALVLAQMNAGRRQLPLLITQNYGHGRTAVLATGGTWRWQMSEALGDPSHDLFWQQLLRWLVNDSPGPVSASVADYTLLDDAHVQMSAHVQDRQFQPAVGAHVTAHIIGPQSSSALVDLEPASDTPGLYRADWSATQTGAYVAEVTAESRNSTPEELGRDVVTFARQDGIAESFHTAQNRHLLEQLSAATGGRYWTPNDLGQLPRDISYSEAGISLRTTKELWNMPVNFLVLLASPLAIWLLRRKWGVV